MEITTRPAGLGLYQKTIWDEAEDLAKAFTDCGYTTLVIAHSEHNMHPVAYLLDGKYRYRINKRGGYITMWPDWQFGDTRVPEMKRPNRFTLRTISKRNVDNWVQWCHDYAERVKAETSKQEASRAAARTLFDKVRVEPGVDHASEGLYRGDYEIRKGSMHFLIDKESGRVRVEVRYAHGLEAVAIWNSFKNTKG